MGYRFQDSMIELVNKNNMGCVNDDDLWGNFEEKRTINLLDPSPKQSSELSGFLCTYELLEILAANRFPNTLARTGSTSI